MNKKKDQMPPPKRTVRLGHRYKSGKTMDTSNPKRLAIRFVITAAVILAVLVVGYFFLP